MKKYKKKLITSLLTAVMVCSAVMPCSQAGEMLSKNSGNSANFAITQQIQANAAGSRAFNQFHPQWKTYTYTKWAQSGNSLYTSGCMLFSFGNAIHSLTGRVVNITDLAEWACNNGSWRPGAGGGYRDLFYNQIETAYGRVYQFAIEGRYYGNVENSRLTEHLLNGGVATVHVPGHFMAITDYNPVNQTYRVIESAVSSSRGLPASSWVSASKLETGQTKVDWFCLLSKQNFTPEISNPEQDSANGEIPDSTGNQNQNTQGNSVNYFPKYTGDLDSFAAALYVVGADGSYAYREKIAFANGIPGYMGTLEQNKLLFQLLKAGLLIRPDTAPNLSKNCFPQYTGTEETLILALQDMGIDNSYSYRAKIAAANDITGYCGAFAQNLQMLELLRAGNLRKP
ncbi:MAG: hypothetical protein K2G25_00455 [Oscillospiraceae bacterium]|nr:hypothetical protein [Oscillospiraceae bacterium]